MNSAQALTFGDTKAMKKLLLTALSSLAMGAYAADDHKFYAGGGVSLWNMDTGLQGREHINISTLDGLVGFEVLPWLAIEGRFGAGIERDRTFTYLDTYAPPEVDEGQVQTIDFMQDTLDMKSTLNYYASFYLKPQIKNDVAAFYGLLGVSTYDAEFETIAQTYEGTYATVEDENGDEITIVSSFLPSGAPTYGEFDESEATFSMGVGVSFFFKERYAFNAEWRSLIQSQPIGDSDGELRVNGFSANVTYSF